MITATVAKRLLGFPDVEAEMDLGNAALDDVDATISAILDDDEPVLHPPEPLRGQTPAMWSHGSATIGVVQKLSSLTQALFPSTNLMLPEASQVR
jgi:hypothetical protein